MRSLNNRLLSGTFLPVMVGMGVALAAGGSLGIRAQTGNPCAPAARPGNPCNPCAAAKPAAASDCVVPRLQTAAAQIADDQDSLFFLPEEFRLTME